MEHQIENLTEHLTAIRLFVSSTFSDMHAERSCFNDTLVPRLRGLCRDRGVSFFNVDLRWGITGEDIANDKLIPLCLNEVDKCRPFFLAIIGGRYGSQMGPVSQSLLAEYPWLSEKSGASYTDLEITYHFLKNRQGANSLFLFKKCPEPEDPEEKRALQMLKEYIRAQAGERVREYGSLEEFGHIVVQEFDRWLTEMYGQVDIHLERALLVQREIDSHTVRNTAEEESIYKCAVNTTASILVHGDGPLGKTTVLNNVAKDFPDRIVVNCLSDEANVSWPYVAFSIYEKLVVLPSIALDDSGWFEEHATGFCQDALLSRAEEEQLKDAFLKLLDGIRCEKETVLVINDLEYIQGDRTRYLQWLPANTPERFHIVCSTNDGDILNSARIMGWNLIEMQPMKENIAESILVDELTKIGKNAAQARMLLRSKLAGYPGYIKNAIDFLNAFGSFDTICLLSEKLSTADSFSEFYGLILDEIEAKYGADFRLELRLALAAMSLSALPLGEAGCYYVLDAVNETPKTRWSAVSDVLSALRWSYSGGMISTTLRNYITESLTSGEKDRLHDTLGAYWLSVVGADRNGTDTRYLKAALSHYSDSKNVTAILSLLSDAETVKKLCVHNADCVRRGLFVVMFHSDRNVSKVIITRMTELIGMAKPGDDSVGIALLELVRIFKELNLTKDSKRLNQLMELAVAEQIVPMEEMEKESIYDAIDLMARQALERVDDAQVFAELDRMILSPNISPVGKAKCSVIKANLKLKTHHSEVLADTEEAIRLATKAASMSSILSAYDIQITALVWKHRYDEALELISSAEQWAQKMGYAFYLIAYAQQKIVCLYRKEEYEPALAESRRNYDLFMRWGCTDHAQVMQYNIGIILNLSKQYEECIRCVTDVLKDKKLVSKNRVQLLSVLKAAYFNSEKYEKARQTIGLALKEPDLSEETEIHLRLSLAACWLMKGQAGLSKAIPELNCSFTALQKRGNLEPIVYCLSGFLILFAVEIGSLKYTQQLYTVF